MTRDSRRGEERARSVLYGVTVGKSAFTLLRGQLGWFREQGWDVSLAATPDAKAEAAAEREQVTLHALPMTRSLTPLADLRSLFRWIALIRRVKPDVTNVSTPKAGLLGGIAAAILRVPKRIYVVRGLRLESTSGALYKLLWAMERASIAFATDVIFVGHGLAREAAKRGLGAAGKGWVIGEGSSNGIDVEGLVKRAGGATREEMRTEFGFEPTDFVVGFVGRIAIDKGLDTLIAALSEEEFPQEAKLLIVGGTEDEELADRLRALGRRVTMTGDVADVSRAMLAMDVLCLPSRREGFPTVALEAAAMRLPVVATRATGCGDAVLDGETGRLVDIDDHRGLADAIRDLHAAPEEARTMGERGHQRVLADFRPEAIWSGILAVMTNSYDKAGLHPVGSRPSTESEKEQP